MTGSGCDWDSVLSRSSRSSGALPGSGEGHHLAFPFCVLRIQPNFVQQQLESRCPRLGPWGIRRCTRGEGLLPLSPSPESGAGNSPRGCCTALSRLPLCPHSHDAGPIPLAPQQVAGAGPQRAGGGARDSGPRTPRRLQAAQLPPNRSRRPRAPRPAPRRAPGAPRRPPPAPAARSARPARRRHLPLAPSAADAPGRAASALRCQPVHRQELLACLALESRSCTLRPPR